MDLETANRSVAQQIPKVEKDPYRPRYHFVAPAFWMNDPNGPIFYQGEHHVFYQFNPYGEKWGNMHWGHAKTKDFIHWEHLPIALTPSLITESPKSFIPVFNRC
jgi:beta-fructofuranosidase